MENNYTDLFEWVLVPDVTEDYYFIQLKPEPYDGMVVLPRNLDFHKETGALQEFTYAILKNPKDVDVYEDVTFHEYLEDIFIGLINDKPEVINAE